MERDILNELDSMDLSTVPTGVPVLSPGLVEVSVAELTLTPNKKGTGQNLNIKMVLTQPAVDTQGNTVNPGFPIYDRISLVQTDKYDPRPRLAEFKECFTGTKAGAFNPLEQYLGLTGSVRTKVEQSDEYGTKTVVGRYVKKG